MLLFRYTKKISHLYISVRDERLYFRGTTLLYEQFHTLTRYGIFLLHLSAENPYIPSI